MQSPPLSLFLGTYGGGIQCARLDPGSGEPHNLQPVAETPNPSWLCLHPGQRVLYAVNEVWGGREGSGAAFRINTSGGALQPLAVRGSGGRGPCHLTLSPDARLLACANYAGGSVVLLLVAPTATCSRRQRCNSTPAAARIRSGRRRHTRTPWIFRLMAAI